jgi:hypothetical protein
MPSLLRFGQGVIAFCKDFLFLRSMAQDLAKKMDYGDLEGKDEDFTH